MGRNLRGAEACTWLDEHLVPRINSRVQNGQQ